MGQALGVESNTSVVVRELQPSDYAAARRIIATAFAGEAFAFGMFSESPVDRLVGMTGEYGSWPWAPNPIVIGAEAAGLLVAVGMVTAPGECHLCDDFDETTGPGATRAARIEHEFQLACRRAHLDSALPRHGHISVVATDPFIQRAGVGRLVVGALLDRLWKTDAECAVLECVTSRATFYEHFGFRRVVEFDDPGGPDLRTVLMRVDPVPLSGQTAILDPAL